MPQTAPTLRLNCFLIAGILWTAICVQPVHAQQLDGSSSAEIQFFEQTIRPLLHRKCVSCHGATKQNGELRLDTREGLIKGGESGAAIVAHDSASSLLMEAVRYEGYEMPPDQQLSKQEIDDLQKWVDAGAVWPLVDGKSVRLEGASFTEAERKFWSLQAVKHPKLPNAASANSTDNPIDQFVFRKLQQSNLIPAAEASPNVLVRRVYFGLLGVPPSTADLQGLHQLSSTSDGWKGQWDQLVDQLLSDRRYGEHWARYWLDVVRYAESDGFRADFYRPDAWRYRDYVVDAFNNDKPYDRFVAEQIAGDELFPDSVEALVATGYLRTYLYEYNQRDARTQWQDILNQVTDVTGEAFLGLSMGCARCHDHKFDPILQQDYFRLQAAFGSMLPVDDVPVASASSKQLHAAELKRWQQKASALHHQRDALRAPYLAKAATSAIIKFPDDVQAVMAKSVAEQTPLERQLADLVNRQILFEQDRLKYNAADQKQMEQLDHQIKQLAGDQPSTLPTAPMVTDTGSLLAKIHIAGNFELPVVAPGGLSIWNRKPFDVVPTQRTTGARSALAKWLVHPRHPLTARVLVNRIWQHHFGTGLVATASDFGSLGDRPSHPELLDWLASEFVAHHYSIKWLQRTILTSATYRMSSFHRDATACEKIDPGNRLRWRFEIRRLNAEQIRDAMLACSGELSSEMGGPSASGDTVRRALYIKQQRNTPDALLKSLDGTDGLNSIAKRATTTTPVQALNLMNGEWVNARAKAMADRVLSEADHQTPAALVSTAFQIALGRLPTPQDLQMAEPWLRDRQQPRSSSMAKGGASDNQLVGNAAAVNLQQAPLILKNQSPWQNGPFTVVACFQLDSLYEDATVRTIASCWNGDHKSKGWSIGVTSEKSGYQPRNFILQVVTDEGYEVVPSGLRPELGVPYLMAVTVHEQKTGKARASFYLRPIAKERLSRSLVDFKTIQGLQASSPLVLGGRYQQTKHQWDGLVDQFAVFTTALERRAIDMLFAEKFSAAAMSKYDPVAAWNFNDSVDPYVSVLSTGQPLNRIGRADEDQFKAAVADLCHVLLNSNEFIYLD